MEMTIRVKGGGCPHVQRLNSRQFTHWNLERRNVMSIMEGITDVASGEIERQPVIAPENRSPIKDSIDDEQDLHIDF